MLSDSSIKKPIWHNQASLNYAYYPVLLEREEHLLKVLKTLQDNDIQAMRYFYPSLASSVPYLQKKHFEITDDVAKRVVCCVYRCIMICP